MGKPAETQQAKYVTFQLQPPYLTTATQLHEGMQHWIMYFLCLHFHVIFSQQPWSKPNTHEHLRPSDVHADMYTKYFWFQFKIRQGICSHNPSLYNSRSMGTYICAHHGFFTRGSLYLQKSLTICSLSTTRSSWQ